MWGQMWYYYNVIYITSGDRQKCTKLKKCAVVIVWMELESQKLALALNKEQGLEVVQESNQ